MKKLIAVALIALVVPATNVSAQSLAVANAGFENDITTDSGPLGNWRAFNGGGTALSDDAAIQPRTGARHLNLSITGADNNFAGAFQDIVGVTPGRTLAFSVWHKRNTAVLDLDAELRIEWRNSVSNTGLGATPNAVPTASITSNYTQFTMFGIVPAGADTARPVYAIQTFSGGPTNSGQVFVDDITLTVVPEPSTIGLLGLAGLGLNALRRRRA